MSGTYHSATPSFPQVGDMYYDPTIQEVMVYVDSTTGWMKMSATIRPKEEVPVPSSIDKTFERFTEIVNNSDAGLKLTYTGVEGFKQGISHPDFWAGIAVAKYQTGIIDRDFMTDIIIALQAVGAKADIFHEFVKSFVQGKV